MSIYDINTICCFVTLIRFQLNLTNPLARMFLFEFMTYTEYNIWTRDSNLTYPCLSEVEGLEISYKKNIRYTRKLRELLFLFYSCKSKEVDFIKSLWYIQQGNFIEHIYRSPLRHND